MDYNRLLVTTPNSKLRFRRFRRRLLIATFAILIALVFDLAPRVPTKAAPTAEQTDRAREAVRRVRTQLADGKGFATIRLDNADLASLTTLASGIANFGRFDAEFAPERLTLRGSKSLGPVWLNLSAQVRPTAKGFPDTRLQIGDLPLGVTMSRWLINGGRWLVRTRGLRIAPLDDLVRTVQMEPAAINARIHFPLGSGFADDLTGLRNGPVDPAHTAALYCQLIVQSRREPTSDMAIVVRRAFAPTKSTLSLVEQNRSAFVALAMYATLPNAGRLAGNASQRVKSCGKDRPEPLLAGRADLAKHWALSAALAVSLGDDIGTAMGEWKELSDSRPGGSGFSFVDLAADRAGLAVARRASDPTTAATVLSRLRTATDEEMLPVRALALSEGLSERDFVASYRAIDSAQFAIAKDRIDRVIAQTVGRD
jgi:hypothetical protein